ncbi:MAG: hypothetical protein L0I24_12985 [Pseudonocardia sp.]|nr:hypothetical protein [Actinomycetes bacterium]MDN5931956.1 hypothetical protein [Pseudonocardia sp.]
MTTATTASQRGTTNRRRGHQAERDLARWLRTHGFPHAERAVRTGFRANDRVSADPGDIDGTPGIVWSVKDCAVEQLAKWLAELAVMQAGARAVHGLLVHKRRGHADPARWWCWLTLDDLVRLATDEPARHVSDVEAAQPVRIELGALTPLLRTAGWGEAPNGSESDDASDGSTDPPPNAVRPAAATLAGGDRP